MKNKEKERKKEKDWKDERIIRKTKVTHEKGLLEKRKMIRIERSSA